MFILKFYSKLRLKPQHEELFPYYSLYFTRQYSFNPLNHDVISPEIGTTKKINFINTKINHIVVWYEEVTVMDAVRIMHNTVIEAQDKVVLAQEKRREMSKELNRIQLKLKDIYSELDTTSRGEERFS